MRNPLKWPVMIRVVLIVRLKQCAAANGCNHLRGWEQCGLGGNLEGDVNNFNPEVAACPPKPGAEHSFLARTRGVRLKVTFPVS